MREDQLPVLRRYRGHVDPEQLQEAADKDDLFEVAGICEAAAEGADEEEEEDLETADPGDVGRRPVEEANVEGLEHAEGIDKAPSTY